MSELKREMRFTFSRDLFEQIEKFEVRDLQFFQFLNERRIFIRERMENNRGAFRKINLILEEKKLNIKTKILNAKDEKGKNLYSNDKQRDAALLENVLNDEEYQKNEKLIETLNFDYEDFKVAESIVKEYIRFYHTAHYNCGCDS